MRLPECLCHWRKGARTERWDKAKPGGLKRNKKKVFFFGSQQEKWGIRCVALENSLSFVDLPWRNLEVGSSLCRGLKVPTLRSSSLSDGFVSLTAWERTHQWGQAWWAQLRRLMIHHKATHCTSEGRILQSITKSLHSVLSPAMFPKAQTAWRQKWRIWVKTFIWCHSHLQKKVLP